MSLLLLLDGIVNAAASGVTLTAAANTVDGVATAGATANGAILADTASLTAGAATGDATAAGVVLIGIASVVAGAASADVEIVTKPAVVGGGGAHGGHRVLPFAPRPRPPTPVNAHAQGDVVGAKAFLIPGRARAETGLDWVEIDNSFMLMAS